MTLEDLLYVTKKPQKMKLRQRHTKKLSKVVEKGRSNKWIVPPNKFTF